MTRLNLVPPEELMDQHLFAEWREIKMVPKALARSLRASSKETLLLAVPPLFTLGKGHVTFFYDKGNYLFQRYTALTQELESRGVNFDRSSKLDPDQVYETLLVDDDDSRFSNDYVPTPEALATVRERIALRISERPGWYRHRGMRVGPMFDCREGVTLEQEEAA